MKIHLKTSEDPIIGGSDVTADCGEKVANAAVRFWFDLADADAAILNSIRICSACYATRKGGTYLAGVVNGQEAMTEKVSA